MFLICHYGGLLHHKSLSPIDDIYKLTSGEILRPTNNIILIWISKLTFLCLFEHVKHIIFVGSTAFVDPIDEIRTLANKMKQSIKLVSSIDKRRLNHFIQSKRDSWLIITDINLFNDDLLQIRVRKIETKNCFFLRISNFRIFFYHRWTKKSGLSVILYITVKYLVSCSIKNYFRVEINFVIFRLVNSKMFTSVFK